MALIHHLLRPGCKLLLLFLLVIPYGFADAKDVPGQKDYQLNVNNITSADGLSSNQVNDIIQTDDGLIWVATNNGLNRYTGYHFESFYRGENGLSSSKINHIYQDEQGHLWLATGNGIDVFDPLADTVLRSFYHQPDDPSSLSQNNVSKVVPSSDSALLVFYQNGLIDLYAGDDNFERVTDINKGRDTTSINIHTVVDGNNDKLWLGTVGGGLLQFSQRDKRIKSYLEQFANIGDIWVDSTNKVWVSVVTKGLFVKKPSVDSFQRVVLPYNLSYKGFSLAKISYIHPHNQSKLWVVDNVNQRFMLYDHNKGAITDYTSSLGPFSQTDIVSFYQDNSNNLWVLSDGGLFQLAISPSYFQKYLARPYPIKDFKKRVSTRGMVETDKGNILIATYDGMYRLNPTTKNSERMTEFHNALPDDVGFAPYSLHRDSVGDLWVITEGNGLLHYDKSEQNVRAIYREKGAGLQDDHYFYGVSLLEDSRNRFWIGGYSGLYYYKRGEEQLRKFNGGPERESLNDTKVWCLHEDDDQIIWAGTNNGLYQIHPDTGLVQHFFTKTNVDQLKNKSILSIHQDEDETFWLGTKGGGLVHLNPEQNDWHVYSKEHHTLSNNLINTILERNDSTLWLGSHYGLMQFNKKNGFVKTFLPKDGLSHHEFNNGSAYKTSGGQLCFGSVNGLNVLPNKELPFSQKEHQVAITHLEQFNGKKGQLVNKTSSARKSGSIVLRPQDKFFELDFTLTDFQNPEGNRYRYKLKGHDQKWHYLGTKNNLRLNKLPYGNYQLQIQGASSHGKWSSKMATLQVSVLTPYYLQWWFILLVVMTGLLLIAFLVYVWSVRMQKAKLEKLVDEKTQELQYRLSELESSNKELEQYAYIVSHDLKSPLRTIASYTQMLEKKYNNRLDEHANKLIQYIVSGVHQMQNIIQDMLIYSQVGEQGTQFIDVDMNEVLSEAKKNLQNEIDDKGAEIRAQQLPQVKANRAQMLQVFQNLISNAIKYGKKGQQTTIDISAQDLEDRWMITMQDNGEGMDITYQSKAFEPFQRLNHSDTPGTGMGLAICDKVIRLHHGTIWFDSVVGKGTTFYFTIAKDLRNGK